MKVFLGCAELSGQRLMQTYVEEILAQDSSTELTVQASTNFCANYAQVNVAFDSQLCQVMGLIEPLKRLPSLLNRQRAIKAWLRLYQPTVLMTFDAPDFFLPIAQYARSLGIYCVHVVAPSVWAWRRGRITVLEKSIDELHVLYSFEEQIFKNCSFKTKFIGHPLLRSLHCQERSFPVERLLLAPGSRVQEIRSHLPFFIHWAQILKQNGFIKEACLAIAPGQESLCAGYTIPDWIKHTTLAEGALQSNLAVVCSGTATLEIVSQGCPSIIVYDIASWKKWVLQWFVHTPYIGLPNILTQRMLVPEIVGPLSVKGENVLELLKGLCGEQAYHTLAADIAKTMHALLEENKKQCLKTILMSTLQQGLMKLDAAV